MRSRPHGAYPALESSRKAEVDKCNPTSSFPVSLNPHPADPSTQLNHAAPNIDSDWSFTTHGYIRTDHEQGAYGRCDINVDL